MKAIQLRVYSDTFFKTITFVFLKEKIQHMNLGTSPGFTRKAWKYSHFLHCRMPELLMPILSYVGRQHTSGVAGVHGFRQSLCIRRYVCSFVTYIWIFRCLYVNFVFSFLPLFPNIWIQLHYGNCNNFNLIVICY